ncbi:MAG: hypothetical protein GEEBNDBF_02548 [bacterium]|nr:hypothetical protein [bacterium]
MIEAEVIFLVKVSAQDLYYRKVVEDLSNSFSLPVTLKDLRPVRVVDRYFDTPSFRFLEQSISFRVRERRFTTGPESEGRFTLKTPHPDHEKVTLATIRNEFKLNLKGWDLAQVSDFLGQLGTVTAGEPLESRLAIEELSEEAQLGERDLSLHVSFDKVHYINEATYEHTSELIMEVESHGLPVPVLEDIGRYLLDRYPLEPLRESKYQRGARMLKLQETIASAAS